MPLMTDLRPKTFDDFVGNTVVLHSLKNLLDSPTPPHAFMFVGDRGKGKTTLARICASKLGATGVGVEEINCSDKSSVDDIRNIISGMMYTPFGSKTKVYIMDEVHGTSASYQKALLKPLEEPPKHVFFILCTDTPNKINDAVKSRCQIFTLNYTEKELYIWLENIITKNNFNIKKSLIGDIIEVSNKIPRDCLNILDKIKGLNKSDQIKLVKGYIVDEDESNIIDLCRIMGQGNWKKCVDILKTLNLDNHETYRQTILSYFGKVILSSNNPNFISEIIDNFSEPFFNSGKAGFINACYISMGGLN